MRRAARRRPVGVLRMWRRAYFLACEPSNFIERARAFARLLPSS